MTIIVQALNMQLPGQIRAFHTSEDGEPGIIVRYSIGAEQFTALFHAKTGEEINHSYKRPMYSPFAERLYINPNQLGGHYDSTIT